MPRHVDVDAYVATLPAEHQEVLELVRAAVRRAVPGVVETISYDMPAFVLDGRPVLHVAAWKGHLGLYPAPEGDADLDAALAPYRSGASTIKIPWADGVPPELVARVAAHHASRL
ncbi:MAG: DUF1801 domain-containing protein [Nocardioidaceae bacterium]|nr:DUF1801 domain-containing protein [Nocardioidaceae bacterium]